MCCRFWVVTHYQGHTTSYPWKLLYYMHQKTWTKLPSSAWNQLWSLVTSTHSIHLNTASIMHVCVHNHTLSYGNLQVKFSYQWNQNIGSILCYFVKREVKDWSVKVLVVNMVIQNLLATESYKLLLSWQSASIQKKQLHSTQNRYTKELENPRTHTSGMLCRAMAKAKLTPTRRPCKRSMTMFINTKFLWNDTVF